MGQFQDFRLFGILFFFQVFCMLRGEKWKIRFFIDEIMDTLYDDVGVCVYSEAQSRSLFEL